MIDVSSVALYAVMGLSLAIGYLAIRAPAPPGRLGDDDPSKKTITVDASTQTPTATLPPPPPPPPPDTSVPGNASIQLTAECRGDGGTAVHPTVSSSSPAAAASASASASAALKSLEAQVQKMAAEIAQYKQVVGRMDTENTQLKERLAEQASVQMAKGPSLFEDLGLGENRPSALVKRFSDLYSDARTDAWDAIDLLQPQEIIGDEDKDKLLFSVVVLCFRQAEKSIGDCVEAITEAILSSVAKGGATGAAGGLLNKDNKRLRRLIDDVTESVMVYFRKSVSTFDISEDLKVVNGQLWSKLVDQYASLRQCSELESFTEDTLKIAWALTIQNPRYVIEFDASEFREDRQVRFHSSDPGSKVIRAHLWPALLEQTTGFCVCKAVVIT